MLPCLKCISIRVATPMDPPMELVTMPKRKRIKLGGSTLVASRLCASGRGRVKEVAAAVGRLRLRPTASELDGLTQEARNSFCARLFALPATTAATTTASSILGRLCFLLLRTAAPLPAGCVPRRGRRSLGAERRRGEIMLMGCADVPRELASACNVRTCSCREVAGSCWRLWRKPAAA